MVRVRRRVVYLCDMLSQTGLPLFAVIFSEPTLMLSISTNADAFQTSVNPENITSSHSEKKKHKKKKRIHDEDNQDAADADPEPRTEKKKKRKLRDEEPAVSEVAGSESADVSLKPKKKRKEKGKGRDTLLTEQTDAEIEANSQASAAALLSAIVAASITNPESPQIPLTPPEQVQIPQGQPFVQYPAAQYGYPGPAPPAFDPPLQSVFAPPGGGSAFSELAFGSNEELLRALQDLDMSKIANVLKSLGEASAASAPNPAFAPQLGFIPQLEQLPPSALGRLPAGSHTILGIPPKQTVTFSSHKRTIDMSLPGNELHVNPDHAYLLANKWLTASKLADLVRDEGLVYKKGKFSAIEEQQLRNGMERYKNEKQLSDEQLHEIIFAKADKNKDTAFWSELTSSVPLRPIIAVYHHIRRSYHPLKQQGPWKSHEDDALKQAVADLGQQWEKVCDRVGRMASDCRDRYRNHIVNRDIRVTGHWSQEEEDQLTRIVTDMTIKQGKDIDNDVFWGKVSEMMGGKRGRQQCRIKWTDSLSKTVKNEGLKPRWGQQDAFILVHKVDSLNVRDDTEIDWKLIPDADWNLWSAHTLQRRWLTLKKGVKGYEEMTHQEIMDILRIKKAHLPSPPLTAPKKRKERKITSAPAVNESNLGDNRDDTREAGSSTGPGTQVGQPN